MRFVIPIVPLRIRRAALAMLSALALAVPLGCSSDAATVTDAAPEGFPFTLDNCGQSITIERPPTRAVGYFQHATELMLALGLRASIVGTVYPDNPPSPRYAEAYETIPEISNKDASIEQLVSVTPDFIYGGYASAFEESAGRSRQAFADAGITTYLNPEYCATEPITMDDVYREVQTIGRIFGVPERAATLVEEMRTAVADARVQRTAPVKVFVYDSGEGTAFTAGGQGIGNQIIEMAGGTNIFADVDDTFADVSWEQVVERSPDVVLIYDYFGTPSVEAKKEFLRGRSELAEVPAIRDDRFAVLTLQDAVLGVRAPYAVQSLAAQLAPTP